MTYCFRWTYGSVISRFWRKDTYAFHMKKKIDINENKLLRSPLDLALWPIPSRIFLFNILTVVAFLVCSFLRPILKTKAICNGRNSFSTLYYELVSLYSPFGPFLDPGYAMTSDCHIIRLPDLCNGNLFARFVWKFQRHEKNCKLRWQQPLVVIIHTQRCFEKTD